MENYKKVSTTKNPFPKFPFVSEKCIHMNVKNGSKIKNLLQFSLKEMDNSNFDQIGWWGDDKSITKAMVCAEHLKKKSKFILYQITKIFYNTVIDKYEPICQDLEILEVTRNVPSIFILLSKNQFNQSGLQYQTSEMNIHNLVFNSCDGKAIKVLKKVKRKENYAGRLQNSVMNN